MKQDLPKKISLFAEQVAYILLYMLAAEGNIGSPYEVGVFFFFSVISGLLFCKW